MSELLSVASAPIRCPCDECKRRRLGPGRDGSSGLCSGSVRLPATRSIPSRENDTGRIEDLYCLRPIPFQLCRSEDGSANPIIARIVLKLARNMNTICGFLIHATATHCPTSIRCFQVRRDTSYARHAFCMGNDFGDFLFRPEDTEENDVALNRFHVDSR